MQEYLEHIESLTILPDPAGVDVDGTWLYATMQAKCYDHIGGNRQLPEICFPYIDPKNCLAMIDVEFYNPPKSLRLSIDCKHLLYASKRQKSEC